MQLQQMRNDADNAHICVNMREYVRIFANICGNAESRIDLHQCNVHRRILAHGHPYKEPGSICNIPT